MTEPELMVLLRKIQDGCDGVMPFKTKAIRVSKVEAYLVEIEMDDGPMGTRAFVPLDPSIIQVRDALAGASFARSMALMDSGKRMDVMAAILKELKP